MKNWAAVFAVTSLFAFAILDNVRGPFYSQVLQTFSLTDSEGAWFFAISSLFAALGSWFGYLLVRPIGAVKTLIVSMWGLSLGFAGMGWAPNKFSLWIMCALFGVNLGIATLGQHVIAANASTNAHKRRRWLSALHCMYGFSSLFAPSLAYYLLRHDYSWRQAFWISALSPLLIGIWGSVQLWSHPETKVAEPDKEAKLNLLHVWIFAGAIASYLQAEIILGTRVVRYLEVVQGWSASDGSLVLMGYFATMFLSRLFFAWFEVNSHVWARRFLHMAWSGAFLATALGLTFSPWFLALAGLFFGPFYPLAMAEVRERFGAYATHAMRYMLGLGSGTVVVMHFIFGYGSDQLGIGYAFWVVPGGLVMAGVFLILERFRFGRFESESHG